MAKQISLAEVKKHNKEDSVWMVIHNNVYDVTAFLNEHPGGAEALLEVAGTDSTQSFEDVGHSEDARELLKKFKIGEVPAGETQGKSCKKWDVHAPPSSKRNPIKYALIALAGAIVIGFLVKRAMASSSSS